MSVPGLQSRRPVVCFFGTFDAGTNRSRQLLRLLSEGGFEVRPCHAPIWADGKERYRHVRGGALTAAARMLCAYPVLGLRLLLGPRPDLYLVGYPGYLDVPLARLVGRIRAVPVVFDPFVSLYDTLVSDRGMVSPRSLLGRLAKFADRWSCRLADCVLVDTPEHGAFFARLAGLPETRFRPVWLGAEDRLFRPHPEIRPEEGLVLFHGTFVPLQGVPLIVRAAKLLEGEGIRVRIIGRGQESGKVARLVEELKPSNIELIPWLPPEEIARQIAGAALCLGIFGASGKAGRVVPYKVFECAAVGRPVLTADTPAIRSAFVPGAEVAVCPPGDPEALAAAVRELMRDPGRRGAIALAGHARYSREYSEPALRSLLHRRIAPLIRAGRA